MAPMGELPRAANNLPAPQLCIAASHTTRCRPGLDPGSGASVCPCYPSSSSRIISSSSQSVSALFKAASAWVRALLAAAKASGFLA